MKKNVASQSIGAQMITAADGSDFTTAVTVTFTIDNGTQTAGAGAVVHEGGGYHSYSPAQAETNGDHIAFSFAAVGAITATVQVYTSFPQSVDNATGISSNGSAISALNDFNPATELVEIAQTSADKVWLSGTRTLTDGFVKNQPFDNFQFLMVLSYNHVSPGTGLTVTGEVNIDDVGFVPVTGTISEISDGIYSVDLLAADTNGSVITYKFSAATADNTYITVTTQA